MFILKGVVTVIAIFCSGPKYQSLIEKNFIFKFLIIFTFILKDVAVMTELLQSGPNYSKLIR